MKIELNGILVDFTSCYNTVCNGRIYDEKMFKNALNNYFKKNIKIARKSKYNKLFNDI
jgi:hypothetical protein